MIELGVADYRLALTPERGGSVAAFAWRDVPLFRATCGPSILDTACFPLVPFSNRIAEGRFEAGGRTVRLPPNFPGAAHPHPLHGFGWQAAWTIVAASRARARLRHEHAPGAWPWRYVAEQEFRLSAGGLRHTLQLRNLGTEAMPAGLGFHPYFPRDARTRYLGLHHGEWATTEDGLPFALDRRAAAVDWWCGAPVGTRAVDTVYAERRGPLDITWPDRGVRLRLRPDALLSHSVVYTPPGRDFFCVEPVTHPTNAVNRPAEARWLRWLKPGEAMTASLRYTASSLDPAA